MSSSTGTPKDPRDPESPSILLVEDDLDQAYLVRFLLEGEGGYRVTLVQDGVTGSEMAAEGGWALVITDLNLPGRYGMEVVAASRSAHPEIPILATTGYSGPEYVDEARRQGADEILLKPLDRDQLLTRVAALIAGEEKEPEQPSSEQPSPEQSPKGRPDLTVLAVGLRPGEAEAGVGGTLLRHMVRGHRVVVLTMGPGGVSLEEEPAMRERTRTAGRRLGARFFMGSVREAELESFKDQVHSLLGSAMAEARPDVLYLPTPNRTDEFAQALVDVALALGPDISRIFCYDVGDANQQFRPEIYMPVDATLEEKLQVLATFEFPAATSLHPDQVKAAARYWGRNAASAAAEPLEAVHGGEPWTDSTVPD